MVYKKYIYKKGKKFGPYFYESYRDENGKVCKRYLGRPSDISPEEKKVDILENNLGDKSNYGFLNRKNILFSILILGFVVIFFLVSYFGFFGTNNIIIQDKLSFAQSSIQSNNYLISSLGSSFGGNFHVYAIFLLVLVIIILTIIITRILGFNFYNINKLKTFFILRRLKRKINFLIQDRKNAEIILKHVQNHLNLHFGRKIRSNKCFNRFMEEQPKLYSEFNMASNILKFCFNQFNSLVSLRGSYLSALQSESLDKLLLDLAKQLKNKMKKAKTELEKQKVYSEILDKYLQKLGFILFPIA